MLTGQWLEDRTEIFMASFTITWQIIKTILHQTIIKKLYFNNNNKHNKQNKKKISNDSNFDEYLEVNFLKKKYSESANPSTLKTHEEN